MRLILVPDVHIADRPPSIRTDDYTDLILDKLTQVNVLAKKHKADGVICVGDLFHVKSPGRNSHALVQRLLDVCRDWVIVPGNHDITHDDLESLDKQPLGTLFEAGVARGDGEFHVAGGTVFCVPWLGDWSDLGPMSVYMDAWKESQAALMVAHAPILPPKVSAPYWAFDAGDWAAQMERPGHVFYGHIHDCHEQYVVSFAGSEGAYQFCNYGALSRGSLHEESLKRKPAVVLYDTKGKELFKPLYLKVKPVEEVFKLAIKEQADAKTERLDEFLGRVRKTELEGLSVEKVLADIETMDLRDETRRQIQECLEVALSKR